jgi:quercetin dioxygenase-like cupin family protein
MARKQVALPRIIAVDDLDAAVDNYTTQLGYRLDMIFPADSPSVAVLSGHGTTIRLEISQQRITGNGQWVTGRARMEYRDLIPGRLDGKVIASHIRIPNGGEVADYVHYHKVDFQMIYSVAGAIRVVYEDQGEPFWLVPGDCVLQPPEIRHRVLEATAGAQVIEIGSPAVHETWADHEMALPTGQVLPNRDFGGQRFVHHIAADSPAIVGEFGDFEAHHTGISSATGGLAAVFELRSQSSHSRAICESDGRTFLFYFVLSGRLTVASERFDEYKFTAGESIVVPPGIEYELDSPANSEILCVFI